MAEFIENENVKFWFEDDVLCSYYKKGCVIDIQEAKEIVELRLKFINGKMYDTLTYADLIGKMTPEARKYFAKKVMKELVN